MKIITYECSKCKNIIDNFKVVTCVDYFPEDTHFCKKCSEKIVQHFLGMLEELKE